jgi:hypothetical protein
VCGNPILQYHHIVEWSVEQHFRPEDMMVLCPLHHDQASKGAMTEKEQRAAPVNVGQGRVSGLLAVKQDYCAAQFGTVTAVGEGPFLHMGGEDLLCLDLGPKCLDISLKVYNEADELIAEIRRNEWIAGDPLPWDIEAHWQKLVIRDRARSIVLDLDAKQIPTRIAGLFRRGHRAVEVGKLGVTIPRTQAGETQFEFRDLAFAGATLEIDERGFSTTGQGDERIVSWPEPRERLWKAAQEWRRIKAARAQRNVEAAEAP